MRITSVSVQYFWEYWYRPISDRACWRQLCFLFFWKRLFVEIFVGSTISYSMYAITKKSNLRYHVRHHYFYYKARYEITENFLKLR